MDQDMELARQVEEVEIPEHIRNHKDQLKRPMTAFITFETTQPVNEMKDKENFKIAEVASNIKWEKRNQSDSQIMI